jgi:hypothetical protein
VCGESLEAPTPEDNPRSQPPEANAEDEAPGELEPPPSEAASEEAGLPPSPDQEPEELAATSEPAPERVEEQRVPQVRTTPHSSLGTSLARWREFTATVTALAIPAAAFAAYVRAPGQEWGQLFLFGVLFGIGLNLTIPDLRREARPLALLLWPLGTALLLVVPAATLVGSPLSLFTAIVLLVAGGSIDTVAAWRFPRGVGVYPPWLSGLLLLSTSASVPLALLSLDPIVTVAVWLAGGVLGGGPAVLLVRRRLLTAAAARVLAEAEGALSRREYVTAIGLYDRTADLCERLGRSLDAAHYGKGAALVAIGKLDEAVAVLDGALSANPRNEVAWVNKGTALTRMGRLQDALKCYNSAIKVNARYEVAWNNKGNALTRLGKEEWALQCYEQALSLDPSYRTAWVNKGYVLAKLGRFDEAAQCADRALQLTAGASA